ncbi:protein of unknown function [Methylocaldum szegediense]|uniref:Uncharacterized protein n=1 Tax=Methylocaldum szegediense TaxID=73780 RepID=A0ABM9HWS6_9GAMM|nr:protein of unknown function [Methylocaldum szegediense]
MDAPGSAVGGSAVRSEVEAGCSARLMPDHPGRHPTGGFAVHPFVGNERERAEHGPKGESQG